MTFRERKIDFHYVAHFENSPALPQKNSLLFWMTQICNLESMKERNEFLLTTARSRLAQMRDEQRALSEMHLRAKVHLDQLQIELQSFVNIRATLQGCMDVFKSTGEASSSSLQHLTNEELEVQVREMESEVAWHSSLENVANLEAHRLHDDLSLCMTNVNNLRESVEVKRQQKAGLDALVTDIAHFDCMCKTLSENISHLEGLQSDLATSAAHLAANEKHLELFLLEISAQIENCASSQHHDDADGEGAHTEYSQCLQLIQEQVVAGTALNEAATVLANQNTILKSKILYFTNTFKKKDLENEIAQADALCKNTAEILNDAQVTLSSRQIVSSRSLENIVESRQRQISRLEAELGQALDDLSMLQDKKTVDRCVELTHAIKSYASVTIPGVADKLRSVREDIVGLKSEKRQWDDEQARHASYIALLRSEKAALQSKLEALEKIALPLRDEQRQREAARADWSDLEALLQSEAHLVVDDDALDDDPGDGANGGVEILEGDAVRYVPIPTSVHTHFFAGNQNPASSAKPRRKAHWGFFAVTIMHKLQEFMGLPMSRDISLSL